MQHIRIKIDLILHISNYYLDIIITLADYVGQHV